MAEEKDSMEIPRVPQQYFGLLGNLPDMDTDFRSKSIWHLQDLYGPIYELDFIQRKLVVVSNYELFKDVQDDERFEKIITGALMHVRDSVGDGLFTAHTSEPNWHKAHRILMPVFGPIAVRKMFHEQLDIASQMVLKWDRLGPEHEIVCSDDFTRLAFDTIGLCAFNFRFNDFYSQDMHPFADQMANSLLEAGRKADRSALETKLRVFSAQKYWDDIKAMHKLCDDIVDERIKNPQPELNDLLNVMLNAEDPETHEKLSKENIRYQMGTFLIAGHETTSGTLSFLFYHLLKNPETYHKAQKEVDEVVGDEALTIKHLPKLQYVDACIKETLRFMGPITGFTRRAKNPTKLAGKYAIYPDTPIFCNLRGLHHDPAVWGEDADLFRPERMIPFDKVPSGAWYPFGVGMRSCIGRAFAEQEMIINVALILQRFQVDMVDPSFTLGVKTLKSTLTIKPDGFNIRVRRRPGKADMVGLQSLASGQGSQGPSKTKSGTIANGADKPRLTVLYGSNAGTSKSYAEELANGASEFAVSVQSLDSAIEQIPSDHPVIIITPSYEGKPPDNGKKFVSWLESNMKSASSSLLKGVKYSVFGVGNSEWATTFHKIPKLVDQYFLDLGATRIQDAGFVDVKVDPAGPWETYLEALLGALGHSSEHQMTQPKLKATIVKSDSVWVPGGPNMSHGTVANVISLCDNSVGPPKNHIEIELSEKMQYTTGDYLAVSPLNHYDVVERVLKRFSLEENDRVMIEDTDKAFLKTATPMVVKEFLASRVELWTPVTQKQLEKMAAATTDQRQQASIQQMASSETFETEILPKRFSILDILEKHPSCELSFASYLDLLKALALRQYSISSSALSPANLGSKNLTASLTFDVHTGPAFANPEHIFNGVASSHLAGLQKGNQVRCMVKSTNTAFHLPKDPSIPIIMIAAGSGIAPMRGFIEERASLAIANGQTLGPAMLYFGCRDYEKDYIYKSELEDWQEKGIVDLRPTFSKRGPPNGYGSWRYVPDRMWEERDEIAEVFNKGAKIFVCGSASKLGKSTADVCMRIYRERTGASEIKAIEWLEKVKEDRYVSDVFG